jgi:CBS domain-containing protein
MKQLRDIIGKQELRALTPESKLLEALELMVKYNIHHVAVVSPDTKSEINGVQSPGELVGILSDKDMRLALNIPNLTTGEFEIEDFLSGFVQQLQDHTVQEIMTNKVITKSIDTPIKDIVHEMKAADIDSIPIVANDTNSIIGIVTTTDLMDLLLEYVTKE